MSNDPIDPREVRADGREGRADFREGRADAREGSASRRDDRAGSREGDAVDRDERADTRDDRADVRSDLAEEREGQAVDRETRAIGRDGTLHRLVKVLIALTLVLVVVAAVSVYRAENLSESVDRIESVQVETNRAAIDTLAELRTALEQAEDGPDGDAIVRALEAVARIEQHLCGGPCPNEG